MATSKTTARTGAAPRIRKLYERYPEMSKSAIARRVGCSVGNVNYVLTKYLRDISEDELSQFRRDKPEIMESIQHRLLSSLDSKKIAKTNAVQAVTAVAILEDKIRLQRGQATTINVSVLHELIDEIRREDSSPRTIESTV